MKSMATVWKGRVEVLVIGNRGGAHWVSVNFVHLASCATFDVVGYEVFHVGPPVEGLDELDGFGDSGVSGSYGRVKMVKYTPPKIVVFHNNEGRVLS